MTRTSLASSRGRISAGLAILSLAVFACAGCVAIPTPAIPFRDIPSEQRESLQPGETRRVDILMRYGEPELRIDGDRVLVYRWTRLRAIVLFLKAAWPVGDVQALFLEFGADGRLTRLGISTAWRTGTIEEQAQAWSRGESLVPALK